MKIESLTFLFAFTLLVFFSGFFVVFADDFQNGLDAYHERDYETASKLIVLLAEQGDKNAQYSFCCVSCNYFKKK